jgi:selenocysteine lyase/cysteine desulfurase
MFVEFRKRHEGLEDGTVNFLSILSVPAGLEWLRSLGGPSAIHTRCHEITQYAYKALSTPNHNRGCLGFMSSGDRSSVCCDQRLLLSIRGSHTTA